MAAGEQQQRGISSKSTGSGRLVTPFWKSSPGVQTAPFPFSPALSPSLQLFFDAEKYERDARRYWDIFYKRHEDKLDNAQGSVWVEEFEART
ncbi:hypothetical protein EJB05_21343 [Eragrostis curvula]|uniref:Uncharacterized protein n=1 Tax=Eragrostis curvula TaxID=38414 RepID=A0A5J9V0V5_9POAL|nr:hypothetical protein EJB05_21343 [Eragrostis curvula]